MSGDRAGGEPPERAGRALAQTDAVLETASVTTAVLTRAV